MSWPANDVTPEKKHFYISYSKFSIEQIEGNFCIDNWYGVRFQFLKLVPQAVDNTFNSPVRSWSFFPRCLRSDFIHWVIVLPIMILRTSPIAMGRPLDFCPEVSGNKSCTPLGFRGEELYLLLYRIAEKLYCKAQWMSGSSELISFSVRTHLDLRELGFRAFSWLNFKLSWRLFGRIERDAMALCLHLLQLHS